MLDSIKTDNQKGNEENLLFSEPRQEPSETLLEVICDVCPGPNVEYEKPSILLKRGWEWGTFGTFCPGHKY